MITKQSVGLSPTLSVSINGVPVNYMAINEVEMFFEAGLHDMCVIRMAGIPTRAMLDYRNRPVTCSMDLGGGLYADFFGYIADVRATAMSSAGVVDSNPFQDSQLVCIGTSYEMRGSTSRVWNKAKLEDVALAMSETYGFSVEVPTDDLLYHPIVQDNESDWQFLTRYATMMGYETTLHGTRLHIFDPYKAFTRGISYHVLRSAQQLEAGLTAVPGQISKIDVSLMENHPDGVYKDTSIYVHQDDNVTYEVTLRDLRGLSAPARFTNRLRDSVDSYEQAKRAIDVVSKSSYDYTAKVTTMGVPGCLPGGIVRIDSYGDDRIDGLWYVKEVHHRLHSSAFVSDLRLVRNINSELVPTQVTALRPPADSKLINDRWVPSKKVTNVYT